ncbi:MAG: TIGR00296 family protein [Candidatus Bathyarchaeota archaeon]|nr:TIGR00296 family protein [Candidatus Bathyarchaeota archaeon]
MPFELTLEDGKFLVELARETVTEYLQNHKTLKPPVYISENLKVPCGVFVTINTLHNKEKELRGCIGYPYPTEPLVQAVIDSAINAATEDPRFEPMQAKELDKVVFEVSVLTPPEQIQVENPKEYLNKIKVGEDGLIVESGFYKGLLLPQVPVEWCWCEEEFLCQCCLKAGVPPDRWLNKNTKIYRFKGIVFEEETPDGEIKQVKLKP